MFLSRLRGRQKETPADANGYKYMEVGREAKRENTNSISRANAHGAFSKITGWKTCFMVSCMTFRLCCTSPKVERVRAPVRKMIRSGATMRKTQRRETHRACRRVRELRNGVRRQEKRDLYIPCYFPHSCTCLASDQTTPKRGRNCNTTPRRNFSVSRATCLVHALCNKKSI